MDEEKKHRTWKQKIIVHRYQRRGEEEEEKEGREKKQDGWKAGGRDKGWEEHKVEGKI